MKRSVDFPIELLERLQVLADKKYVNVSVLVKIACSEYLEREENKEENKK